jgi:hypothetical protein
LGGEKGGAKEGSESESGGRAVEKGVGERGE